MMSRIFTVLGLALALAGCGVDGEPIRPEPKQATGSGVRVSGTARVGISVSRSGVNPLAMGSAGQAAVSDRSGF